MLQDFGTEFSTAQPINTAVITTVSQSYDLGASKPNIAKGIILVVQVFVDVAFVVGLGTPYLQILVVQADSSDLGSNAVIVGQAARTFDSARAIGLSVPFTATPLFTAAELPQGATFYIPICPVSKWTSYTGAGAQQSGYTVSTNQFGQSGPTADYQKRFLGMTYVQPNFATAFFSQGAISARLMLYEGQGSGVDDIYKTSYTVQ